MGKKIKTKLRTELFPYIYGLCFLTYKSLVYPDSFSLMIFIVALSLIVLFNFLLISFLSRYVSKQLSSWFVLLILIISLHFVFIAKIVGYDPSYIPESFLVFSFLFIFFSLLLLLLLKKYFNASLLQKINYPANIFLLILLCTIAINGLLVKNREKQDTTVYQESMVFQRKPNILWLLLDEYGSSSILSKGLKYQNSLDSILVAKGFILFPDIKTRYHSTLYSVNNILRADSTIRFDNYYQAVELLRKAPLVGQIEEQGYEFKNISYFDIGGKNKIYNQSGYPQNYVDQITAGTIFYYIKDKIKYTSKASDFYTQSLIQKISQELSTKTNKPKFIWSHIMMPHEPFTRNSQGLYQESKQHLNRISDSTIIAQQYIGQVRYINGVISRLFDKHPQLTEYLIVISGDHGPRYDFLKPLQASSFPYAAVFIPDTSFQYNFGDVNYVSDITVMIQKYLQSSKDSIHL